MLYIVIIPYQQLLSGAILQIPWRVQEECGDVLMSISLARMAVLEASAEVRR